MANKLNIPNGEYKNTDATQSTYACVEMGEETVLTVQGVNCYENRDKETSDIALLCADSINTYNQKPVLPSELLKQRDLLLCALKKSNSVIELLKNSMLEHPDCTDGSEFDDFTDTALDRNILNNALIVAISRL